MSRSNPSENSTPNPAVRWFEWNGEHGVVRYYDKEKKENVVVGSDFTFLLLDQLGSVRGWHDASDSGIYSNEVKDTRQDALIVKAFKGGTIAEGIYKSIKDRVNSAGGQFVTNCYIAFKLDGLLRLGSIRFKGAALNAWVEFSKANRNDLYVKAVRIHGFTEGKKGRIVFRVPILKLIEATPETEAESAALDRQLQAFLDVYLKRTKRDQVEDHDDDHEYAVESMRGEDNSRPLDDSEIPF